MELSELRELCLALPGVTEDIKWEHHLCFNVGKKMFMITSPDEVPVNASFKVSEEEFAKLITKQGFKPASHLARYHWVHISDLSLLNRKNWKQYAEGAYRLIAEKLPKAERKKLGLL